MAEADDLVQTAHVVEHLVVEARGFLADAGAKPAHGLGEEFRQHDADDQMRDQQFDGDGGVQREQRDRVDDRGHYGDDDRRDGVREEDLQQFDVGGDQRDQVALAFAGQFGGRETAQRGECLRPEQREQPEGHVVVHVLLGVAHATSDERADDHGRDCHRNVEIPDFVAGGCEQGGHAEDRQEGGCEMPGDTARAGDRHVLAQGADLAQQPGDDLGYRHGGIGGIDGIDGIGGIGRIGRIGRAGETGGIRGMRDLGRVGFTLGFTTVLIMPIIMAPMTFVGRAIQTGHAGHPPTTHPLHVLLRTEQLGVRAVHGHKLIVRALLHDGTPIKHDHMVRVGRVRHAVCDHQHGLPFIGERADRP